MNLQTTWDSLAAIRSLNFRSRSESRSKSGWSGSGVGTVRVEPVDSSTMLFHESGVWTPDGGTQLNFTNVFRWTADRAAGTIHLEHLRFGPDRPVDLFDLAPRTEAEWRSIAPHVCRESCYEAELICRPGSIVLHWSVTGPGICERIKYLYSRTASV